MLVSDEKSHTAQRLARMSDQDWWRQAAVYQIYPRSFADANADGIGDLKGVLSKIDYLDSLGIDAVWFSPFYPSALADGGYDVDDYRDIDPTIGSLAEFDDVIRELHDRGIKVIIDIVPNHSSNRHVWFQEALRAAPGSPARERYHFRDGLGASGELPPTDWQSAFVGPAWTRVTEPDGTPGQWYLHLFTPEQPDWNWSNPEVREEFLTTLRFWGERGVDGFRVDVAMALAKDMSEPFPSWKDIAPGGSLLGMTETGYPEGAHPLFDRDEVDDIYADWRQVFNSFDPPLFAVAEAWVAPHRRKRYASSDSLGQAFNFDLLAAPWNPKIFRETISRNLDFAAEAGSTITWVFSNHDVVRHATRYAQDGVASAFATRLPDPGNLAQGLARATAATMMTLALPGSAYIYQGEELGLPEVIGIPGDQAQDPWARIEDGVIVAGRDGCRVPLPWTSTGPHFGFSDAASHLPQPDWFSEYSVEAETAAHGSTLALYRRALTLRRELTSSESVRWLDLGPEVVAFVRENGWTSVTNFGDTPIDLPDGDVILRSDHRTSRILPTDTTAWIHHRA